MPGVAFHLQPRSARAGTVLGVALAAAIAALAVLAFAPAADAAPKRFPAAGQLNWSSVPVRAQPSNSARRVMVLRDMRVDRRPQIVLATSSRLVGHVAEARASVTLKNTSGANALSVTSRLGGKDGNTLRVSVQDVAAEPESDEFVVYFGTSEFVRFRYPDGNVQQLVAEVNSTAIPLTLRAVGAGPLAKTGLTPLAGGRDAKPGQLWYKLNLPIRPFGQTGWIPAEAANVRPTKKRIVVNRGARTLTVFQGNRAVFRTRVAVGRADRPTPRGNFYVAAKYVPPRNAMVSAYALELSAPAGLPDFLGGGVVGIHGTPAVSSIGRAASNGCIRVRPAAALRLKAIVPLGTPVKVIN